MQCALSVSSRRAATVARMQFNLVPHPAAPPSDPAFKVWVERRSCRRRFGAVATTNIWFGVGAPAERFVIPEPVAEPGARRRTVADDLLRSFLRPRRAKPIANGISRRRANGRPTISAAIARGMARRRGRRRALHPDRGQFHLVGARRDDRRRRRHAIGSSACPRCSRRRTAPNPIGRWPIGGDKPDFHDPGCFAARLP